MIQSHLKEMLRSRRMSIREFARKVDYRFETVRLLHNSTIDRIPVDLIELTCKELNCEVGELLTLEEGEESGDITTKMVSKGKWIALNKDELSATGPTKRQATEQLKKKEKFPDSD